MTWLQFFSHTLLFRWQLTHIFLLDERKLNFCFLFLSLCFSIWPFYFIEKRNFTPDSLIFSHQKSSRCWKYGTLKRVVGDRFCNWFRFSTENLTGVFCWNHFTLVITYLFFFFSGMKWIHQLNRIQLKSFFFFRKFFLRSYSNIYDKSVRWILTDESLLSHSHFK